MPFSSTHEGIRTLTVTILSRVPLPLGHVSKQSQQEFNLHPKPVLEATEAHYQPPQGLGTSTPTRTRTGNQLIKSQLLCQLSYRGIKHSVVNEHHLRGSTPDRIRTGDLLLEREVSWT